MPKEKDITPAILKAIRDDKRFGFVPTGKITLEYARISGKAISI